MRWLTLVLVLFLAGCGAQWFPSDNSTGGTSGDAPTPFFFTSDVSAEASPSGSPTASNVVTLAGTAANGSWPVTVENISPDGVDNFSQVMINNTPHSPGESGVTAKPGDTIQLVHNASFSFNGLSVTKLTVGGYVTTYTTTTVPVVDASAPDAFIKSDGTIDTTRTIAPDTFSLTANAGATSTTSEPITLSGGNPTGWSFAVRDLTGFGGTFLTVNGETSYPSDMDTTDRLYPWQTFKIQHDIGGTLGNVIRTRVVIGNYSTVYQTKIVQ